jgi:uncharacterized protein YutE (UPF0331/DUF86 family)
MDWRLIEQKLESLRRCVHRVEEKCPKDADTLAKDYDAQDILALNLTRAVQLCVDIGAHLVAGTALPAPDTMGQTFDILMEAGILNEELARRMKMAVGFCNLAIHNYDAINWAIVYAIARERLTDFEDFGRAVVVASNVESSRHG